MEGYEEILKTNNVVQKINKHETINTSSIFRNIRLSERGEKYEFEPSQNVISCNVS